MPETRERRTPRQERSRALVDAILDATADILRVHGLEHTTTTLIAARAGVSVGSLYQYFPNKTALYHALGERFFARLDATADAVWPALLKLPPRQAIDLAVQGIITMAFVDPVLDRILHQVAISRLGFEPVKRFEEKQERRLAELLAARRAELPNPHLDVEQSARIITRALGGVISSTFARDPQEARQPWFPQAMGRLFARYLGFES